MSLCHKAKTNARVELESSEEFFVRVGVHQESVLLPLLFAISVDVITVNAKEGLMNKILCANDSVF